MRPTVSDSECPVSAPPRFLAPVFSPRFLAEPEFSFGGKGCLALSLDILVVPTEDFDGACLGKNMGDSLYLASAYRMTGVNFRPAAETLAVAMETKDDGTPANLTAIPFYFVASHAAELFLKSALLKRGFTESDLKQYDYRHSLNALLLAVQGCISHARYGPVDRWIPSSTPNARTQVFGTCSGFESQRLHFDGPLGEPAFCHKPWRNRWSAFP